MPSPKRTQEYREGPAAAREAESLLRHVLTVSKVELAKREVTYHQQRMARKSSRTKTSRA